MVEAFHRFPKDFHLRGYPEYPDASDIHKPLYLALAKGGYVTGANKKFRLTAHGLATARHLLADEEGLSEGTSKDRVSREDERELERLRGTRAYRLYMEGRGGEVVDTDFYGFFKVSVRTKRHEFVGRIQGTEELTDRAHRAGHDVVDLQQVFEFLRAKFGWIVREITGED